MKSKIPGVPPHLWVALSNWVSRAGSVAAQLICLPLLSKLLTSSEFAAYAITVSLMTWYQLADFGFGSSTQNYISEARARSISEGHYIAAAALIGCMTLFAACFLLWPLSAVLDNVLLRKLALPPQVSTQAILGLSGVFFIGSALGAVAFKILYALQKGVQANLITLINSLGFLLLLWGCARHVAPEHRLLASVLAYSVPMGVTGTLTLSYLALRYGAWNKIAIKQALHLIRVRAWRFWLFALLGAFTLNVDYIIMSHTLEADEIAKYNILFRIFGLGMALYSGLLTAAWPIFSIMNIHNNYIGISRHVRFYLTIGLGTLLVGSIAMIIVLPWILKWLAPGLNIQISVLTLVLFSVYIGLRIWTDTHAVALQAMSQVDIFLKVVPVQALLSIMLQWFLAQHFGINGILMGLSFSFILTVFWILPMELKRRTNLLSISLATTS